MPQCKAKFCTVPRGQGISTFPIPDPLKNRPLCEQWINKLGIDNLNIRTFKFSRSSIVCANHFEDDCFKEDLQAKLMGYTPKYRYLKDDAVPTIFKDSKPSKTRQFSEKRSEKKQRVEMLENILNEKEETQIAEDTLSACSTIEEKEQRKRKKPQKQRLKL